MTFRPDAVMLAWVLAALLFFLSCRSRAVPGLRQHHAAAAGVLILAGATIYGMDVVNLPEIMCALIIGGAAGLLLGRDLPTRFLPSVRILLAGLAGVATIFAALAAWLNPHAFGLIPEMSDEWRLDGVLALVASVVTGGGACILAAVALLRRDAEREERGLVAKTVWIAAIGGMAGWSVTAIAVLLGNPAAAVAGGLAGAAGSVLALRLWAGRDRKGVADASTDP